jgi:exosortase
MSKPFAAGFFVLLCALSVMLWWQPLRMTLFLALHDDAYTHLWLIIPLVAGLIAIEWRPLEAPPESDVRIGPVLLVIAIIAASFARWRSGVTDDLRLSIAMFALVTWWIGSFWLCFGRGVSRRLVFPLGFLFWMVPIPAVALNRIVESLQSGSATMARFLFLAVDVPVSQQGIDLTIPGLTLEVAKECSSIRSSLVLLVTTMFLAQLLLRSSWRKALLIALTIPLALAKNGLRIFAIAILGTRDDPAYLTGRLHQDGGPIFFMIALLFVFLMIWILRRGDEKALPAGVFRS